MNPRRTFALSILTFALAVSVVAQNTGVEYGRAAELRGVTEIFVDTGSDLNGHDLLVKEIHRRLPSLSVVARPEEADVHLRYDFAAGAGTIVKVMNSRRQRVLYRFRDDTPPIFARDSLVNYGVETGKPYRFVWEFARAYRKANSENRL